MTHSEKPVPVLAFSGRTSAGKSSVTQTLASGAGWPRAAFGDFVRATAARRGMSMDRKTLQDLGESLISELGWEPFCLQTLALSGITPDMAPCIVDGIRHVEALECLRSIFAPNFVMHIHLDVGDEVRATRLMADGVSEAQGADWERHSTERDVLARLPERADLRIDVDGLSPDDAAALIEDRLRKQNAGL